MYNVCLTIKCDNLEEAIKYMCSLKKSYNAERNANNSGIQQLPHYETENGKINILIREDLTEKYREYVNRQTQK